MDPSAEITRRAIQRAIAAAFAPWSTGSPGGLAGLGMRLARRIALRRPPDFVIGDRADPYLLRWYMWPRNRWANLYLHLVLRADDERALHDHPWANASLVLAGGYREVLAASVGGGTRTIIRPPGSLVLRRAATPHRLALLSGPTGVAIPAITLFATGPRVRLWGFHCRSGWVPWTRFVQRDGSGSRVGAGCDAAPSPDGWRNRDRRAPSRSGPRRAGR